VSETFEYAPSSGWIIRASIYSDDCVALRTGIDHTNSHISLLPFTDAARLRDWLTAALAGQGIPEPIGADADGALYPTNTWMADGTPTGNPDPVAGRRVGPIKPPVGDFQAQMDPKRMEEMMAAVVTGQQVNKFRFVQYGDRVITASSDDDEHLVCPRCRSAECFCRDKPAPTAEPDMVALRKWAAEMCARENGLDTRLPETANSLIDYVLTGKVPE